MSSPLLALLRAHKRWLSWTFSARSSGWLRSPEASSLGDILLESRNLVVAQALPQKVLREGISLSGHTLTSAWSLRRLPDAGRGASKVASHSATVHAG